MARFHSKCVIERDIFTHCTDYREGAADAENLIDSGGLKSSLSGYDSVRTHTHTHTYTTNTANDLFSLFKWQQQWECSSSYYSCPHLVCRHLSNLLVYH